MDKCTLSNWSYQASSLCACSSAHILVGYINSHAKCNAIVPSSTEMDYKHYVKLRTNITGWDIPKPASITLTNSIAVAIHKKPNIAFVCTSISNTYISIISR